MLALASIASAQRTRGPVARRAQVVDAGVATAPTLWCGTLGANGSQRCMAVRAQCEVAVNALALQGTTPRICAPVATTAVCYAMSSAHVRSAVSHEYVCFGAATACEADRARTAGDPRVRGDFDVTACSPSGLALATFGP